MKKHAFLVSLLLFVSIVSVFAKEGYAVLTGTIENRSSDSVFVYGYNSLTDHIKGKSLIQSCKIGKKGFFFLSFKWPDGGEFELKNGDNYLLFNVFLCSGDSLNLVFSDKNFEVNGRGEDQIGYNMKYVDSFYVSPNERKRYTESFGTLGIDSFTNYIDNRYTRSLGFLKSSFEGKNSCPAFSSYATNEINYNWATDKLQYLWKYNYAHRIKGDIKVDPSYFVFAEKLKSNKEAEYSQSYYNFLSAFIEAVWSQHLIRLPETEMKQAYKNQYFKKAEIVDSLFEGMAREISYALIIRDQTESLQMQMEKRGEEVKKESDSLLNLFHNSTTSSVWYDFSRVESESAFSFQGKILKDFKLISNLGDSISFSSFKGKVVLLDFWSLTCAPCLKAIPESNDMQARLSGKDFVMVSICLDPNKKAEWEKLLINRKWKGVHLLYSSQSGLQEKFSIQSFPRYILIDKEGKIVSANAPVPGPDPEKEILHLL